MGINTISKTFSNVKTPIMNAIKSVLPIVCGVPESVLGSVSNRYILSLYADLGGNFVGYGAGDHEFTVHAYLQDKITLHSHASWEGIMQSLPGDAQNLIKKADTAIQIGTGVSAIATVSKARKWAGSDPIKMTFKLKFEAVNDVYKEVLEPCMGLQSLTLPRGGFAGIGLVTPGPSPFTIPAPDASDRNKFASRGENISINIGDFLGFQSVIVEDVTVVYENRMSAAGPIGASVDLTVTTWSMLTREQLQGAYKEKLSISSIESIGNVGRPGVAVGKTREL
jgi:hypothetical protein